MLFSGSPRRPGRHAAGSQPDPRLSDRRAADPGALEAEAGDGRHYPSAGPENTTSRTSTFRFALGAFNVVTGVSGAGKSTLVRARPGRPASRRALRPGTRRRRRSGSTAAIGKIVEIDQSPIGRTPRSNPRPTRGSPTASATSSPPGPKPAARGWGKGRFSFNVKGGRCETCQGAGLQQIGMHFLGDVEVVCPECEGRRFNDETLEIRYGGKNIHDVLEMSFAEAAGFFRRPARREPHSWTSCVRLGLGYLKLGPELDDPLRRRGPAHPPGLGARPARVGRHALHPRRADDGPPSPRRPQPAPASLQELVDKGNTIDRRRARPRVHPAGRSRHRSGARERGRGRPGRRRRDRRKRWPRNPNRSREGPSGGHSPAGSRRWWELAPPPPDGPPSGSNGVVTHNLKNIDVGHPLQPADRHQRPVRERQVLARIRHALRGVSPALYRKLLSLRPKPHRQGRAPGCRLRLGPDAAHRYRSRRRPPATRARPSGP